MTFSLTLREKRYSSFPCGRTFQKVPCWKSCRCWVSRFSVERQGVASANFDHFPSGKVCISLRCRICDDFQQSESQQKPCLSVFYGWMTGVLLHPEAYTIAPRGPNSDLPLGAQNGRHSLAHASSAVKTGIWCHISLSSPVLCRWLIWSVTRAGVQSIKLLSYSIFSTFTLNWTSSWIPADCRAVSLTALAVWFTVDTFILLVFWCPSDIRIDLLCCLCCFYKGCNMLSRIHTDGSKGC